MHSSTNSHETVIMTGEAENLSQIAQQNPNKPHTRATREYKYITLKEALKNLADKGPNHLNKGLFLAKNDPDAQKLIDSIQKEIKRYVSDDCSIENARLRGRKDKSFTVWVSLKEDKGELQTDKLFSSDVFKNSTPKITSVTFVSQEDIRLVRLSQNDKGVRLYEVINQSCRIKFDWKVGDKDFSITVDISSDGKVTYSSPSEGLNYADLEKNTAVKIRTGYSKDKDMTLKELISKDPRQQASGETLTINPETTVTSVKPPEQHLASGENQAPASQSR
ncbi:hypothetical protein [Wolbachia endosymbiont of Folsomia candida]|uniref:hypothetical protein n=1 Tax=Wolbachia endosymbiont of Folsomia candida TaxID=169402 RepID=UPI000A9ADAFD|nr:hypothetical protein [Wolbachia endosymbiont of Folsomia candida]APR98493.1 hypothetical protein ASM33_04480 [Wolbachia endosymbiont of Folsomia candida]